MTRIRSVQLVFGALLALILHAASAQALEQRTWVSGTGSDTNPCTRTLPCRQFATALYKTVEGGEISVLDSGDFRPFEIDKSISIVAEGVEAAITVNEPIYDWDPPNGIEIYGNAQTDIIVSLHGLILQGNGGRVGIFFAGGGGQLHMRSCLIRDFKNAAVAFEPHRGGGLFISNTTIANNANGIEVLGLLDSAITFLDNVIVERNSGYGVNAYGADALVQLNDTTITANGTGLRETNGGQFVLFGNNTLIGNSSNGVVPSLVPLQ